jgi:magnesium chelatase subunit H
MRFLFLTMEATNNSALKTAAEALRQEYGIGLDVSIVNIGLNNSHDVWQRLEAMIGTMDFVFGSMLFSEEVVRPLEHLLDKATCPVCMITSNPSLISKTTLGRFSLRKKTEQDTEKNIFMQWTGKLRPKHKHGENQRQLALVRNISRIMKHIPGKARDIHSYIAAHQFWLNGSEENMKRFLSLLIDRYIPGWKGKLPQ